MIFHYPITQKTGIGRKQFDVVVGFIHQKTWCCTRVP